MHPTTDVKSPFLIYEDAISPLQCERIVDSVEFITLDVNKQGKPIESTKTSDLGSSLIHAAIQTHAEEIATRYGAPILDLDATRVIWSDSTVSPRPLCDNSVRVQNSWLRVHNRDLVAVVFMSDFNDKPPFDSDFEVYGGKMEFPSHGFGFNPVRGTMIILPCDPHFTHLLSPISIGDLYISKTYITLERPLIYSPKNFPGTWSQWLSDKF